MERGSNGCYGCPPMPPELCCRRPIPTQPTNSVMKEMKKPLLDMLETDRVTKIKIDMENKAYERKLYDNAKFNVHLKMSAAQIDLDKRRDKLKEMLENEDECYLHEIVRKFDEKSSSKIDEMRERVKKLRDEREKEQKKVVEQKLNQLFQEQSDEMRTLISKRMGREIAADWDEQLNERKKLECEEQEEEKMWACLNILDMQEKMKREESYKMRRQEYSKRALDELNKQMEIKRQRESNREKLALREKEMIEADLAAAAADKRKLVEEKGARYMRAKEHVKEMLETRNYYRDRKLKREEIVAREFLKKAVRELYVEQEDKQKRKRDLMRAITIYREYLKKRDCLENSRESALQRIIDGVIEEQYEKKMASRKREHDQRKALFKNVMAGRSLQLKDLEEKRAEEEAQKLVEVEKLKEDWKNYLVELDEERAQKEHVINEYVADLGAQVAYKNLIRERELAEVVRQDEMCELEEKLFKHRLQKTINSAALSKDNPYRQPLIGKTIHQCFRPV